MTLPSIDQATTQAADDFTRLAEKLRKENSPDETSRDILLEEMATALTKLLEVTTTIKDSNERQAAEIKTFVDRTLQNLDDQDQEQIWHKLALRIAVVGGIIGGIVGLISIGKDIASFSRYLELRGAFSGNGSKERYTDYRRVDWKILKTNHPIVIKPTPQGGGAIFAVIRGNVFMQAKNLVSRDIVHDSNHPNRDHIMSLILTGVETTISTGVELGRPNKNNIQYVTAPLLDIRRICEVMILRAREIEKESGYTLTKELMGNYYYNMIHLVLISNERLNKRVYAITGNSNAYKLEKLILEDLQNAHPWTGPVKTS